jgi:16S rRNA processing protein RimM
LVALGVVARPHGVRGELRVKCHNPESELLEAIATITLRRDGRCETHEVLDVRAVPQAFLLRLSGITDRDAAEGVRGAEVCVPREALPPLPEGEYYHVDLIGLAVEASDGRGLGRVVGVIDYPAADCLEVEAEDGTREVPMRAPYLVEVDVARAVVVVDEWNDLPIVGAGPREGSG